MLTDTNTALQFARARGIFPTWLDTQGIREALPPEMRKRAVFSAQTTNEAYLGTMKRTVERMLAGEIDQATGRTILKRKLSALGYDPETGFDGDGTGTGAAGSMQDLGSDVRLNLILSTQFDVMHGHARALRETTPERVVLFPAWELIRVEPRDTERTDHAARWAKAGGPAHADGRMVAWKWHPVWAALGDSEIFPDGLDTEFAPYWFASGVGIREVSRPRAEKYLGPMAVLRGGPADAGGLGTRRSLPPLVSPELPPESIAELQSVLQSATPEENRLTFESVFDASLNDLEAALKKQTIREDLYETPEFDE